VSSFEDGDITMESIKTAYQAHLANGVGNLTNRIMKMATSNDVKQEVMVHKVQTEIIGFDCNLALKDVMREISLLDEYIANNEPFKVVKVDAEKGKEMIAHCLSSLNSIALNLSIFLPRTSTKILECIRDSKMPEKPLFNRLP
jgi:methionyl-tRNA synthetase